ncbi:aminotransferase class III-fold pyridoxal phosphate-dependent enzyme [Mycobacterium sp. ITM-2016-00317]|uniref:aspartate aminotransferase family protein n=1 Tax=Mycobacterium sp. ITM-2016-00317 TaxID=2099694 RepID=UPI000D4C8732|nr:aminotransferase class III-fold pyridoxal phosphate-dependent enzyme [Mycobacterium sp. ITM-2016-00317]WNG87531.1 aminotransferase class III-fold pyridoxal phosphate-dependent enzyme [Mycobacterium sp. ITM-2016-00317]
MSTLRETLDNAAPFAEMFTGPSGHSLLPGGFGRAMFAVAPRTPMAVRGCGCYLRDDAGRTVIDLNNNFTSQIHGNAHPEVTEAIQKAAAEGTSFGLPNMHEIEHASLMLSRLRYMDQIRYTNSGTEAVMLAVRLSRAATGRDKVVFVQNAYHGHSDVALIPGGPKSRRGIPQHVIDDTIEIGINDHVGLAEAFAGHGDKIAAVIIDTLPNRAGLIAVTEAFWQDARELTSRHGAVLVSDEVISLRLAYDGAGKSLGAAPDLMAMGKIIGAGLPVGAVTGRADLMGLLNSLQGGLEHGGTTAANPVTMAAGIATMRLYPAAEVDRLNRLGERVRTTLGAALDQHGWEVRGGGSLFRLFPKGTTPQEAREQQVSVWWEAYERGIFLGQNTMGALSTPMTDDIVDDIIDRVADAVANLEN